MKNRRKRTAKSTLRNTRRNLRKSNMKIKTNRNLKQSQHEDKEKNRSTSDVENSSQMEIRQNDDHASAESNDNQNIINGPSTSQQALANDNNRNAGIVAEITAGTVSCIKTTYSNVYARKHFNSGPCVFCQAKIKNRQLHYQRHHTASRLSTPMLQKIRTGRHHLLNKFDRRTRTMECPLCEEIWIFTLDKWIEHIVKHTGEHLYGCLNCNERYNCAVEHRRKSCKEINQKDILQLKIINDVLYGYICTVCNYFQLERERVVTHLTEVHETLEPNTDVLKIKVVPKFQPRSHIPRRLSYRSSRNIVFSRSVINNRRNRIMRALVSKAAAIENSQSTVTSNKNIINTVEIFDDDLQVNAPQQEIQPVQDPLAEILLVEKLIDFDDDLIQEDPNDNANLSKICSPNSDSINQEHSKITPTIISNSEQKKNRSCVVAVHPSNPRPRRLLSIENDNATAADSSQATTSLRSTSEQIDNCSTPIALAARPMRRRLLMSPLIFENESITAASTSDNVMAQLPNIKRNLPALSGIETCSDDDEPAFNSLLAIRSQNGVKNDCIDQLQSQATKSINCISERFMCRFVSRPVTLNTSRRISNEKANRRETIKKYLPSECSVSRIMTLPSSTQHYQRRLSNDAVAADRSDDIAEQRPKLYNDLPASMRSTSEQIDDCSTPIARPMRRRLLISPLIFENDSITAASTSDNVQLPNIKRKLPALSGSETSSDDDEPAFNSLVAMRPRNGVNNDCVNQWQSQASKSMNCNSERLMCRPVSRPVTLSRRLSNVKANRRKTIKEYLPSVAANRSDDDAVQRPKLYNNLPASLSREITSIKITDTKAIKCELENDYDLCDEDFESSITVINTTIIKSENHSYSETSSDAEEQQQRPNDDNDDDDVIILPNKNDSMSIIEIVSDDEEDPRPNVIVPCKTERKVNVKLWTKNCSIKYSAQLPSALYKCMAENCVYFTQSKSNMIKHLEHHAIQVDRTKRRIKLENGKFLIDYLLCAYCSVFVNSGQELVDHIEQIHSKSIFQCSHCYYRSVDVYSVAIHIKEHHQNKEKKIFVCPPLDAELPLMKHQLNNALDRCFRLRPISCHVCKDNRKFYAIDHLVWHYDNLHESTDFNCPDCSKTIVVSTSSIAPHLIEHHIGEFHCLYCRFASNDLDAIQLHIADQHFNEYMLAISRHYKRCTPKQITDLGRNALIVVNVAEKVAEMGVLLFEATGTKYDETFNPETIPTSLGDLAGDEIEPIEGDLQSSSPNSNLVDKIMKSYEDAFCSTNQIVSLGDYKRKFLKVSLQSMINSNQLYEGVEKLHK